MKAKEVHKLSAQELVEEEARLRRKLFDLRSQSVTQKLENPHAISAMRRDVASPSSISAWPRQNRT